MLRRKTGVLLGLAHAAACFFVPFLAAQPEGARPTASLWMVGQAAFAAILGAVSLEACLIVRFWTWPFAASVLLSYGLFFPFVALLPRIEHGLRLYRDATHGTGGLLFSTAYFWLSILAVYFITFGMRYIERFCKWYARPDDVMLLAERDRAGLPPAANYTDQQPSDEGSTNGGSNGGAAMA